MASRLERQIDRKFDNLRALRWSLLRMESYLGTPGAGRLFLEQAVAETHTFVQRMREIQRRKRPERTAI